MHKLVVALLLGNVANVLTAPSLKGQVNCGQPAQLFMGSPVGIITGSNTRFMLRQPPGDGCVVKLFVNGVQLNAGSDFTVSGQHLNILKTPPVRQGDVLSVSYVPADASRASQKIRSLNSDNSSRMNSLLRNAIIDAINHEESFTGNTPSDTVRIGSAGAVPVKGMVQERQAQPRSTVLLTERLNQSSKQTLRGSRENGPDGLGDMLMPSTYDLMLGTTKGKGSQPTRSATGAALPAISSSRSIDMLGRLLDISAEEPSDYSKGLK